MRKTITIIVICLFICFFFTGVITRSYADSAQVMPKGVVSVILEGKQYFPVEKKFDKHGNKEDIAVDYNANLNSTVFHDLQYLEEGSPIPLPFPKLPPGSASIGNSVVSFELGGSELISLLQYGLTDRLTLGVRIPLYWRKNEVKATLDASKATVGKNAALNTLTPLTVPGTVRLTTQDAQNLIGRGLDINGDGKIDISGFGFKPVKSWSDYGVSDIEVGGRYQYLRTDKWQLAFTGGVRFPTGEVDDPDNLTDIKLGDGAYALLFQSQNDFDGIKNLLLNATVRYELVLPHKERLRVPDRVHQPLTLNEENVDRNIGDKFEIEISGIYDLFYGFSLSLLYKYGYKFKDHVSGNRGFNYESLEDETDAQEHIGVASLCYTTIPLYQAKKFPLPMSASVSYRDRFAGVNRENAQYISLAFAIYF
jgi:hypothetical protein